MWDRIVVDSLCTIAVDSVSISTIGLFEIVVVVLGDGSRVIMMVLLRLGRDDLCETCVASCLVAVVAEGTLAVLEVSKLRVTIDEKCVVKN